jgi:hypothetical protein
MASWIFRLVGTSAHVIGRDEHLIDKAVHPRHKYAHSHQLTKSKKAGKQTPT